MGSLSCWFGWNWAFDLKKMSGYRARWSLGNGIRAWRPRRAVTGLQPEVSKASKWERAFLLAQQAPFIRTAIRRTSGRTEAGSALPCGW
jgi:hypothetical protein